jgi:hypothetical protein
MTHEVYPCSGWQCTNQLLQSPRDPTHARARGIREARHVDSLVASQFALHRPEHSGAREKSMNEDDDIGRRVVLGNLRSKVAWHEDDFAQGGERLD